jgi:putative ABC transport system permease protein
VESTSASASLLGLGAVLMMFGFAFLAPLLVRPLAGLIGAPLAGRLTGRLARENAIRQPQRTAVTAAALMVGLALVVLVAIFAAGLGAAINRTVDNQMRAALIVQGQSGGQPISAGVLDRMRQVPDVEQVSAFRFAQGIADGDGDAATAVNGVDPATVGSMITLKWEDGDARTLTGLTDRQALLDSEWAETRDLTVGSTVTFTTPLGRKESFEVAGIFSNQAGLTAPVIVTNAVLERSWDARNIAYAMASAAPGTDPEALARAANRALESFPAAEALTREQFKDRLGDQINQLLGLVYGLLLLSVIVALLGIVNTLALSVHERTRELGMLRAVGMSRRQVRQMVRAESVITALIGAVLGTVLGIVFALIVSRPLADQGFVFVLPVPTLVAFFVLAAIAGVLAAIPPARRAARVDVLRAVTTE